MRRSVVVVVGLAVVGAGAWCLTEPDGKAQTSPAAKASRSNIGRKVQRSGDEIMVCGQLYHTTAKVVLWTDPGGYDAYRVDRRFAPSDEAPWGKGAENVYVDSLAATDCLYCPFNSRTKPESVRPLTDPPTVYVAVLPPPLGVAPLPPPPPPQADNVSTANAPSTAMVIR